MDKVYTRYIYVNNKRVVIYAIPKKLKLEGEYNIVEEDGDFNYVVQPPEKILHFREGEVKFVKLPDEQSLLTFFPFYFLLGKKRRIVFAIDEIARRLRAGLSQVTCFYKGCRNKALFYVEAPQGLAEGGCWYACSREHFSPVTSKGVQVKEDDYRRLLKLDWI